MNLYGFNKININVGSPAFATEPVCKQDSFLFYMTMLQDTERGIFLHSPLASRVPYPPLSSFHFSSTNRFSTSFRWEDGKKGGFFVWVFICCGIDLSWILLKDTIAMLFTYLFQANLDHLMAKKMINFLL